MADFRQRVAALLGRTVFREPSNGRSTSPPLTDQDVALAISLGRRRDRAGIPDSKDYGPEIAVGLYCRCRHRKPDVTSAVTAAIRAQFREFPYYRTARAVNAAYEDLVMMSETKRPPEIPPRFWEFVYSLAFGAMQTEAELALDRAEKAFYREGRARAQVLTSQAG